MTFYRDINHEDFLQVLEALPESPTVIRAHLVDAFGVLVDSSGARTFEANK